MPTRCLLLTVSLYYTHYTAAGADEQRNELRRLFAPYGECTECDVLREEDGSSRGFGFVRLSRTKNAAFAKKALDGSAQANTNIPLKVRC